MGGPVGGGLGAWWPIYLMGGLVLLALIASGGAIARAVGGGGSGFLLGVVAFGVTAWTLRVRWGMEGENALLLGFVGSLVVGGALYGAGRVRERRRPYALAAVWVVTLLGSVLIVSSTIEQQEAEEAREVTRQRAERAAEVLERSNAPTADGLVAFFATEMGSEVVEASGDRFDGGIVLVLRLEERSFGHEPDIACWRYRVAGEDPRIVPEPVGCP